MSLFNLLKRELLATLTLFVFAALSVPGQSLAPTPPMGWNSWDSYGPTVTEAEVRSNAEYMAKNLKEFGWEYIVVDIQWYEPDAVGGGYRDNAVLVLDQYGRTTPALNRFPSAANGQGFKPLADYIHSLGLKFGLHIMRGIPRQAVNQKLPILGTKKKANDIADKKSIAPWQPDMYGVNMKKKGAQEYYDSVAKLYAEWGVDYIKADDMIFQTYHEPEIIALAKAIKNSGRPMVLSLSPGEAPLAKADSLRANSQLWRISGDFWDRWKDVRHIFDLARNWAPYTGRGGWPDADMLPFGRIGIRSDLGTDRKTNFTRDEQLTVMSLWSIFRSPLMLGGDLPSNDVWDLSLVTNKEVLAVNQDSANNRALSADEDHIIWIADAGDGSSKYVAIFNISDTAALNIEFGCAEAGIDSPRCLVRDLWDKKDMGIFSGNFNSKVNIHGAKLYRISRAK